MNSRLGFGSNGRTGGCGGTLMKARSGGEGDLFFSH